MTDIFRNACRIHLRHLVHRYLMANTEGRWDGAEKAQRHREMCQFYVAMYQGQSDPEAVPVSDPDCLRVHSTTQQLTDRLDEAIGFPLAGRPDYDLMAARFFERFHELAMRAWIDKTKK